MLDLFSSVLLSRLHWVILSWSLKCFFVCGLFSPFWFSVWFKISFLCGFYCICKLVFLYCNGVGGFLGTWILVLLLCIMLPALSFISRLSFSISFSCFLSTSLIFRATWASIFCWVLFYSSTVLLFFWGIWSPEWGFLIFSFFCFHFSFFFLVYSFPFLPLFFTFELFIASFCSRWDLWSNLVRGFGSMCRYFGFQSILPAAVHPLWICMLL